MFRCFVRHALLVILGVLSISNISVEAKVWRRTRSTSSLPPKTGSVEGPEDFLALVKPSMNSQSMVVSQAMDLLSSLQSAPSCNREATSNLLTSCQSIDGPPSGIQFALEDVRARYAVQLALCELQGAGSAIPASCDDVSSSETGKASATSDRLAKSQLKACLHSLESRPQWWTSYSNSRQNAVVLCQAARAEIERDEVIELYKSMARTSGDIEVTLIQTVNETRDNLIRQREFAATVENFQKMLSRDLEQSTTEARSWISKIMQSLDHSMQTIFGKISTGTREVESELAAFVRAFQKTNNDVNHLNINIGKIFAQVLEGSSELAAAQTKEWDINRDIAAQLQHSLESMRGDDVATLVGAFGSLHNQLHTTSNLLLTMHAQQTALSERLSTLDTSLASLEIRAQNFHDLQFSHFEHQKGFHSTLQREMQITSEKLQAIDASALSIRSNINDLSFMLGRIASLGGVVGTLFAWKWPVLAVLAITWFSPRAATLTALSIILVHFLHLFFTQISSEIILTHHASGLQISLPTLLRILGVLVSVPTLIFLVGINLGQSAKSAGFDEYPPHRLAALTRLLQTRLRQCEGLIMHTEH